jgi:hypothetical protein
MKISDQIFLCYAQEDEKIVTIIFDKLIDEGFNVWFDKVNLQPGVNWKLELEKAIRKSRIFIACLSSNSVSKTGYVQREIKEALEKFKEHPEGDVYIIPVLLSQCEVPVELSKLHWADLSSETGFLDLFASLRKVLKIPLFSNLRVRANFLLNSHLIEVSIIDSKNDKPIRGAVVELNKLEPKNKEYIIKEQEPKSLLGLDLEQFFGSPIRMLRAETNDKGLIFFGIDQSCFDGKFQFTVSVSAYGYGFKHKRVDGPELEVITVGSLVPINPNKIEAIVFDDGETEGSSIDERICLRLLKRKDDNA